VDAGYRHFLGRLSKLPWSLPCACLVDGRAIGVCFMRVPQLKHLSAYLVPLFADAGAAHRPLALYMRHAFWTFPLHKLYTHVPAHESAEPYASLLRRAGFREEGTLKDHAVAGDRTIDALLFGLLRAEFDAWCAAHEPRLLLS
jgi:RimJ/RimL family protein N-acetyltransferase